MKNKKITLSEIKIKSFVTNLNEAHSNQIKGGSVFNCPKSEDGICSQKPTTCPPASGDPCPSFGVCPPESDGICPPESDICPPGQ